MYRNFIIEINYIDLTHKLNLIYKVLVFFKYLSGLFAMISLFTYSIVVNNLEDAFLLLKIHIL